MLRISRIGAAAGHWWPPPARRPHRAVPPALHRRRTPCGVCPSLASAGPPLKRSGTLPAFCWAYHTQAWSAAARPRMKRFHLGSTFCPRDAWMLPKSKLRRGEKHGTLRRHRDRCRLERRRHRLAPDRECGLQGAPPRGRPGLPRRGRRAAAVHRQRRAQLEDRRPARVRLGPRQYRPLRHARRTEPPAAARPPDGRHVDGQRHDRRPRRPVRFRPLGGDGQRRLVVGRPPPLLPQDRDRPRFRRPADPRRQTARSSSSATGGRAGRRSTA